MKKTEDSTSVQGGRIITSLQSTGRIGKTTLMGTLHNLLSSQGIEHNAIDADSEHLSLSKHYSDVITLPYSDRDSLKQIVDASLLSPLTLIDFPAQVTTEVITALHEMGTMDFLKARGVRWTIFVFASGEQPAMRSAGNIMRFFGDQADFIKVYNPARFKSEVFDRHPSFAKMGHSINIPALTASTIEAWTNKINADKKLYSLQDFSQVDKSSQSAFEVQQWLSKLHNEIYGVKQLISPELKGERVSKSSDLKLLDDFLN